MSAFDNAAMQALSDAGAQCGDCGDQPGDRICPDCERCYGWYVAALRKAGWAPRAETLNKAADAVVAENDRMLWATKPGKHWAADLLRRMATAPASSVPVPDNTRSARRSAWLAKAAADAEATHWRRLGITPPVPDNTTGDEEELATAKPAADASWLCPNNPLGHRWITRPFPEVTTPHCELCGRPQGGDR